MKTNRKWHSKVVEKKVMNLIEENMQRALLFAEGDCKKSMKGSSFEGTYEDGGFYTGKYQKRDVPIKRSRPGEPPYVQTGILRNSIGSEIRRDLYGIRGFLGVRIGVATARADNYAKKLEMGTSKMKPRPYLRPTVLRNKRKLGSMIAGRLK